MFVKSTTAICLLTNIVGIIVCLTNETVLAAGHGDTLPKGAIARLGMARFRHDGACTGLVYSPNGKILAGSCSGKIIFWEAATGRKIRQLPIGSAGWLSRHVLDFSPDGKILAVAHGAQFSWAYRDKYHCEISLWDVAAGKYLRSIKSTPRVFPTVNSSLRFAPNGKTLAVTGKSNELYLVEVATGKKLWRIGDLNTIYCCIRFAPDGKTLAVLSHPGTPSVQLLQIVDVRSGNLVSKFKRPKGDAYTFALSPDAKTVALAYQDSIVMLDAANHREIGRLNAKMGFAYDLAFTADCKQLISVTGASKVFVWDVKNKKLRHTMDTGVALNGPFRLALSPDGKTAALGTPFSEIQLWDLSTGRRRFADVPGRDFSVRRVVFSPDGTLLASGGDTRKIYLWDTQTWKRVRELNGNAQMLSFHPDGKWLLSVPFVPTLPWYGYEKVGNSYYLWNVAAGKLLRKVSDPGAKYVWWASFAPDGKTIVTAKGGAQFVRADPGGVVLWNAATHKIARRIAAKLGPGSPLVLTAGSPVDWKESKNRAELAKRFGRIDLGAYDLWLSAWAVSTDGATLGTVWDSFTGRLVFQPKGHHRAIHLAAYSPNGRLLATAAGYPQHNGDSPDVPHICIWDITNGKEVARITSGGFISSIAFAPDGNLLASGMHDGTVLIWDVKKLRTSLRKPPKHFSEREMNRLWDALASKKASDSIRAVWTLVEARNTVPFIKSKLFPKPAVPDKTIRQWIAQLESKQFTVRENAARKLKRLGRSAAYALQETLKEKIPLEQRLRIDKLLLDMPGPSGGVERSLRAIHVLERIGDRAALRVLEVVAEGSAEEPWSQQAKHALRRLQTAR